MNGQTSFLETALMGLKKKDINNVSSIIDNGFCLANHEKSGIIFVA